MALRKEHRLRVFENRVLRRNEVMGGWRKQHNEELHDLCYSPNIIKMIKLRKMRWMGHVTQMGKGRTCIVYWLEGHREGDHKKYKDIDGWIKLRWMLERKSGAAWTGLVWFTIGASGVLL
jgi:hypothetical protein